MSGERVGSLTSYTKINGGWHSTMNQTNEGQAALHMPVPISVPARNT